MAKGSAFRHVTHQADLCVIGGGMAGLCAALAAARRGAQVVLMHERPVLGGNASSECRVPISGADIGGSHPYLRETGILEELRLENCRRNPHLEYSLWDLILYEKARAEPNLTLLLNCSCLEAEMEGNLLTSVTGWQLTTETYHSVRTRLYADCSGDGVLIALTGHPFRMGREAREEYGESIAPEAADARTMGHTCFVQAREYDTPQPFEPPAWAYRFEAEQLPYPPHPRPELGEREFRLGYWWVELGGEADSIHDTEAIRDELLRIALGVWDCLKNRGEYGADNWALEWVQFLPAKRESRRYLGAHVLTQHDIESAGRFEDVVAYGGWTMDDHHPAGFWAVKLGQPATIFHPAPSPYGIPYRSLYSDTISNLMFAGRCHSATHAALSSTRVMGTCSSMGQAVGTAAAVAITKGLRPAQLLECIGEVQQALLADDCYVPWVREELPTLTRTARLTASRGDPEPVRDGLARPIGDDPHCWLWRPGDWVAYEFDAPQMVREARLTLDSALERDIALSLYSPSECSRPPAALPKRLRVEVLGGKGWEPCWATADSYQRFVRVPIGREVQGLRVTLEETWGAPESRVYSFVVS